MPDHTLPSKETRAEEADEARQHADPGRAPTPDEEAAADSNEVSAGVSEHEREMAERGAHQQGEGKLP